MKIARLVLYVVMFCALCSNIAQAASDADTFLHQGNALFETGKFAQAAEVFGKVIELDPQNGEAYRQRAVCYNNLKNYRAALSDLEKAERMLPGDTRIYASRGAAKKGLNDLKGALEDYNKALELNPKHTGAYYMRGILKSQMKDTAGAKQDCQKAVEIDPRYKEAHNCLGSLAINSKDYDRAIESFNQTLELDPGHFFAYYNRALAYKAKGNMAQAQADCRRALEINPASKEAQALIKKLDSAANNSDSLAAAQPPVQAPAPSTKHAAARIPEEERRPEKPGPAGGAHTSANASPQETPPAKKPEKRIKAPIPPPPPPAPAAAVAKKSPATAKKMAGYKLILEETQYLLEKGGGIGRYEKGATGSWKNDEEKSSRTVRWTMPDVMVPGIPARFRLHCGVQSSHADYREINAKISWKGKKESGGNQYRTLMGVRISANVTAAPDDEYDIVLPKELLQAKDLITQKQEQRKLTIRLRDQEIDMVGERQRDGIDNPSPKVPREVPLEDVEHRLIDWMTYNPKTRSYSDYRDIEVVVGPDYAVYTYRWTPDVGPVASENSSEADRLELIASPETRKELRADGRDGLWLMARLAPATGEPGSTLKAAASSITFAGFGPGAAWLDFSDPVVRDGWKMVYIQASNPDVVRGPVKPPASLTVQATVPSGSRSIIRQMTLAVASTAEIDAKPDLVDFAVKSNQSAQVKVWIDNPGEAPWTFRADYAPKNRPLAKLRIAPSGKDSAIVTLDEAGLDPVPDGTNNEVSVVRIFAEQKDRETLERDIKVRVGQEGLFVVPIGRDPLEECYLVYADGKGKATDIDFRLFMLNPATKKLDNGKDAVGKLVMESMETPGSLPARVIEMAGLKPVFAGIRSGNEPSGIFRFKPLKEIPGDGRIIRADYRVTFPGRDEENFSTIITIGLVTTKDGPGSKDWQLELDRCQEIINKFVPTAYYPKLQELLDKRKHTLGAEGLHELRHQIWRTAVELTLAEGAQGYANEAAWNDNIIYALDWAQWAGDMAFGAVVGTMTGPYGAFGASQLKSGIISAINAYQDGRSPEEWLWDNICTIPGILEGKLIDVDTFEKMGMESKAKAWAIYLSYNFCKNLYQGATVIDALRATAFSAGSDVLSGWLSEKVKKSAAQGAVAAGPKKPADDSGNDDAPAARKPGSLPDSGEANAVKRVRSRMSIQGGRPYANAADVLAIMRDPSMVRALKDAPADVQNAFSNTREAIYRQHDTAVVQHVKDTMPDMKNRMVKVVEFRTPGASGPSLNTDRDYRVCYYSYNQQKGKGEWIEVDRRKWEGQSYSTFARLTGGPTDSQEASKKWAERHQQLATDKTHSEASRAFTDQATIWNPKTRQFEKVQVVPNIVRVKSGQAGVSLDDPAGLGLMYQQKVADAHHKHEAFVQAQKAVVELDAVRDGYTKQKRNVGVLPPSMVEGMSAILRVNAQLKKDPNRRDPKAIAEAEKTLQANGFSSLGDFMKKLSGQFESLKTMSAPKK